MTYEYWERFLELHPRWEPVGPERHSVRLEPHEGVMSCEWGWREKWSHSDWVSRRQIRWEKREQLKHMGHDQHPQGPWLTAHSWGVEAICDYRQSENVTMKLYQSYYSEMCLQLCETDLQWQSKMFWNQKLSESLWGLCAVVHSDLDLIRASAQEPGGCSQDTKQMHTVTVNHSSLQGLHTYVHPEISYCGSQLHIISELWDSMTV